MTDLSKAFIALDAALRDCLAPMQLRALEPQLSAMANACARGDRRLAQASAQRRDLEELLARLKRGSTKPQEPVPANGTATDATSPVADSAVPAGTGVAPAEVGT